MKPIIFIISSIAFFYVQLANASNEALCKKLETFVTSVKPDEIRTFEFHTTWGENFKDSPNPVLFAKRCNPNDYEPAKIVCEHLMGNGSAEFSSNNFKSAFLCLSPESEFAKDVSLYKADVSFSYGTEDRGSLINILFDEDEKVGGMVLKIEVDGY